MMFWPSSLMKSRRKKQLTKHLSSNIYLRIAKLISFLLLLVFINSIAMVAFEKMAIGDAIWLSFTTLTTVGYGDYSPSTLPGRVTTVLCMYCFAITLLSLLAAEIIEWRLSKTEKKRKGLWEWRQMNNHIQIINTPNKDTERYLSRLIAELQKTASLSDLPIQLLTRKYPDGLPDSLARLKILHRTGSAEEGKILNQINLIEASYVVILARDPYDSLSDSITFDTLSQVVRINPNACVVVEAIIDTNRQRFLDLGARAVLRPIRAYPEMIARALSHPGTERVLEDLFEANGDSLYKVPVNFSELSWGAIVTQLIKHQIGTPLAYFSKGDLCMQPEFSKACTGDAVVILMKEGREAPCHTELQALLESS